MAPPAPGGTGIGLTLIEGLARQIGAAVAWDGEERRDAARAAISAAVKFC